MGWLCQSIVVKLDALMCLCKLLFYFDWSALETYCLAQCVCNTLMFPTWPPEQHTVAWGTCLFRASNTLVENFNIRNQTPLTTLYLCGVISSAWTFSCLTMACWIAQHCMLEPTAAVVFLCGALKSNNDYRLRGRMENLAHANHL